eukprot:3617577-Amphidinium_carterae.2
MEQLPQMVTPMDLMGKIDYSDGAVLAGDFDAVVAEICNAQIRLARQGTISPWDAASITILDSTGLVTNGEFADTAIASDNPGDPSVLIA